MYDVPAQVRLCLTFPYQYESLFSLAQVGYILTQAVPDLFRISIIASRHVRLDQTTTNSQILRILLWKRLFNRRMVEKAGSGVDPPKSAWHYLAQEVPLQRRHSTNG